MQCKNKECEANDNNVCQADPAPNHCEARIFSDGFSDSAPTAGSVDYSQPTPETDQFMMSIDDSEIDLTLVRAQIHDLECQRNHYRSILESQPNEKDQRQERR